MTPSELLEGARNHRARAQGLDLEAAREREIAASFERQAQAAQMAENAKVPVDRSARALTDGNPVTDDHREIDPATGMQKGYVVLSAEERARGFVRPVRSSYQHVGDAGPKHPLRDLTADEHERYDRYGYVKFEAYPEDDSSITGKFWTQVQLDNVGKGCGTVTTMGQSLAETYARDPGFYDGTFCAGCRAHFPLAVFVWQGTQEMVGS
jgi:predicted lipid-binding transport protein (Tim44 family)